MEYYSAAVGAIALYGYVKTAVKGYQIVSNTASAARYTYSWYEWSRGQTPPDKVIVLEEIEDKEYTTIQNDEIVNDIEGRAMEPRIKQYHKRKKGSLQIEVEEIEEVEKVEK